MFSSQGSLDHGLALARQLLMVGRECTAAMVEHHEFTLHPRKARELSSKQLMVLALGTSSYITSKTWLVRGMASVVRNEK